MSDIAQLREALDDEKRITDPDFDDYTIEVNSANFAVIYQTAIRQLAIREAGALIITPDEKTVERLNQEVTSIISECTLLYVDRNVLALRILDALRDAIPPEVSE